MKTTELLVCGCCLVIALISTIGDASPAWRPQGRFGKRTHMSTLPRMIETGAGDEVLMSNAMDPQVPVLLSSDDLARLCADPRYSGIPECGGLKAASPSSSSSSAASRLKNMRALAEYLNL